MEKPLNLDSYDEDSTNQLVQYGKDITQDEKNKPLFEKLIKELVE